MRRRVARTCEPRRQLIKISKGAAPEKSGKSAGAFEGRAEASKTGDPLRDRRRLGRRISWRMGGKIPK
jgi:hypothetical protein